LSVIVKRQLLRFNVAGWLLIGRIGSGDPNAGQTANLDSITAVVIGRTSLFGGCGNMIGTLVGALIVGVFINGLQITGVDPLYQRPITGVLVILAVTFDRLVSKKAR
jgi:fructose transport system permease protein